ncbi:trypsin-like serine protease [Rhodobacteraceae bacterium M382]|nr:trypsin-like serine protease [Rhodobacteraceae bacterium M382]
MKRLAAVLVLVLVAPLVAADTTGLRRLSDRDDLLGWEAVGRLDLAGKGFCTATLIAPELVLTAAHCVYSKQTNRLLEADQVTFRAGLREGQSIADRQALQIAAHSGFAPGAPMTWANVRHDVALIRLARPITSAQADPFILHDGATQGAAVSVTSYGMGRAEALSRQRQCQILAARDELMMFDCDVTYGSSGAPVFARVGARGRILSVISGMAQVEGKKVALGMALPARVAELKSMLRRAPAAVPDRRVKRLGVGSGRNSTGAKFIRADGS